MHFVCLHGTCGSFSTPSALVVERIDKSFGFALQLQFILLIDTALMPDIMHAFIESALYFN